MERSFYAVHEMAARARVGMRMTDQMLAIQCVVQAILDRGVYP